jgi:hypothetical protein
MTPPPVHTLEGEWAALQPATAAADELDLLARELLADPCGVVRRACQRADYELFASPPDETSGP